MTDTKGTQLIDISAEMTDAFFDDVKKGQVLGFRNDSETVYYKIVRLNKKKKICLVEPTTLYTEQELNDLLSKKNG